ncbi:MAG: PAS domain S-box protein [Bacteroidetes bacterium]|nr:PAS domain S-box protein [Bacteroidota bacterium]
MKKNSRVFILLTICLFLSEMLIMVILEFFPNINKLIEAFIDASVLSIIIFPIIYNQLFKPLKESIAHNAQNEAKIKNERNLFKALFDNLPDAVYVKDIQYRKILANPIDLQYMGITSEEDIIGKTDAEIYDKEVSKSSYSDEQEIFKTGIAIINKENFFIDNRGEKHWMLNSKVPFRNNNNEIIGLVGISREITERKQAELQKELALEGLEKISSRVPGVVYQYLLRPDGSSCFPFASDAIREIYRVTPEEIKEDATKVFDVLHPDDYEAVSDSIKKSAKELLPWNYEYRVKFNDGTIRWLHGNAIPQKQEDSSVLWHGFITDITERKLSEINLQESNTRFRTILNDAPLGIALIDLETGKIIDANPMFAKITGRSIQELINTSWMSITHPDDIYSDLENKELLASGKIDNFQMEKRYFLPDGSFVWVNMTISHLIKEENMPIYHLCMIENITQKKQTIEKLNMLSQAVDQSTSTIIITNFEGNIEYVNKKFIEVSGYGLNEVIGKTPKILKSGYTKKEEYKLLWNTIKSGDTWEGEFHNKKKNGDLYWESAKISAVKNEKGTITHFMALKEDITARKLVDKKLQSIAWHQSHQIRGPLTTIMGIITAMNFKITLEEKITLLGNLESAAKKMDTAVRTIVGEATSTKI